MLARSKQEKIYADWELLLIPSDLGAPAPSTGAGPGAILAGTDIGRRVRSVRWIDVPPEGMCDRRNLDLRARLVRPVLRSAAEAVREVRRRGHRLVVLHGDDSNVIGIGAGLLATDPQFGVAYFDAHADSNTVDTSPSRCLFGMGVAHLMQRGTPALMGLVPEDGMAGRRCTLLGTRSFDPGEQELLAETGAVVLSPSQIRALGGRGVAEFVRRGSPDPLWLHIDLDVLDPSVAGACACPVEGGLGVSETLDSIDTIRQTNDVVVLSVSGFLPEADRAGRTMAVVLRILNVFLSELP
jgi:arginase